MSQIKNFEKYVKYYLVEYRHNQNIGTNVFLGNKKIGITG